MQGIIDFICFIVTIAIVLFLVAVAFIFFTVAPILAILPISLLVWNIKVIYKPTPLPRDFDDE